MDIRWKPIDVEQWERRDTFLGFLNFDFPYLVIGAELDITSSLLHWKAKGLSPYLSLVYAVCRAGNEIPAFRQRIRNQNVIEYEKVHADFTVPFGKESFTIKLVEYQPEFSRFYKEASDSSAQSSVAPGASGENNDHWIFMSSLPWIQFNHVVQPIDHRSGSIPRIIWGRFTTKGDQTLLPISIQVHHSLIDGLHIARFLECLQDLLNSPLQTF